jgi:glutathione peroxidase
MKILILIFVFFNFNSFANMTKINAYQFNFGEVHFSDYKGKVVLVVNTASKCGFTPQYEGLENLHQKYKDKGLVVIGVPSADFGNQEFALKIETDKFVDENFSINFLLTDTLKVKGKDAHPFYLWANTNSHL